MVITTYATSIYLAFYFQGFGFSLSCGETRSGSVHKVHITLQELQAVALRLYKMTFLLCGKVVASHLADSTAEASL